MSVACRDMDKLNPYVRQKALEWLSECKKQGLSTIGVSETYRSSERQLELYNKGLSTIKTLGAHSFSVALDFYFNEKPNIYPIDKMKKAATIAKQIGFEWGGDWTSFKDLPHLQMLGGVSLVQYRLGKRPTWYNQPIEEVEIVTQADFNKMMDIWLKEQEKKPASSWAKKDWDEYKKAGIVDGSAPQGFLTREQAVAIAERMTNA